VVEELTEEGESGRDPGVVRIVDALGWVGDEADGIGQIVVRVHRAALGSKFDQGVPHQLRVGGEGRKRREQAAEAALVIKDGPGRRFAEACMTMGHEPAPPVRGLFPPA
jgi:hypothetical protein